MSFDASYLSRIRAGQRKPADIASFVDGVCHFIVRKYTSDSDIAAVASMIGSESERLKDEKVYFHTLTEWMYDGELKVSNTAESFLKKLDEFDLSEYIRTIHFDEIKIPTAPFQMPARHSATGLKDMMATELNFLKATVLSRSDSSVLIYSDMPMEQMAKTAEFPKKWMYGMAAMLKKGLHLNMIHNVDRPLQEMMLGLESYIPMYMTGQISPYYLDAPPSKVFHHLLEVSGAAALEGSAIVGHHAEGKYYLTNNKEEVRQYQKRANALLSKAKPLMDIYRADSEQAFRKFWEEDFQNKVKPRHMIFSSLPLFTISDQLLERIISHNHVTSHDKERIVEYVHFQKTLYDSLTKESTLTVEIPQLSREEFEAYPLSLSLSGIFYEADVLYTYEEYREHFDLTMNTANNNMFFFSSAGLQTFRNIQISICKGEWVMVSKNKAPAIHFVIHHPKMVEAIERFTPPII